MPDILRYAGFAKDPNPDGAAPTPTFHVDIASATLDAPSEPEMIPPSSLGRTPRMHRPGFYAPAGNVVYAADVNTLPYFLRWALGGYVFTTSVLPALRTHEIYGSNTSSLETFASFLGKDTFEHVFRGCVIDSLELAVEDSFAMCTINAMARKDAKQAIDAVADLLLPDEYPIAFHEVTVSREASDFSAQVKSLTLSISNNGNQEAGRSVGSRYPRRIPVFERDTRLTMSLYFDGTEELEAFWGGANGPTDDGSTDLGWIITLDAGADGSIDIALPKGYYLTVPTQPSGRDEMTQDVEVKAMSTTHTLADAVTEIDSEILVTAQNVNATMA